MILTEVMCGGYPTHRGVEGARISMHEMHGVCSDDRISSRTPGRSRLAPTGAPATILVRASSAPRSPSHVPTPETLARTHGLRAVAVLLLVVGHYAMRWPEIPGVGPVSLPVHYSIILFFMLAGFLATRSIWREHDIRGAVSLPKFFLRKALKLFPALAVFVAATTVQQYLAGTPVPAVRPLSFLALIGNYYYALQTTDEYRHILGHLWSIAVGAQFLFVWAFLLRWALVRRAEMVAMLGLIGVAMLTLSLRFALSEFGTIPERYLYLSTETRIDALALGALVALELRTGALAARLPALIVTPAAQLALFVFLIGSFAADTAYRIGIGLTVDAAITAVLMYGVLRDPVHPVGRLLTSRPLKALSTISYSLFLWHLHGIAFDQFFLETPFPLRVVAVLGIILSLATLSYLLLERPFRRIAARLVPRVDDEIILGR
jgi:peptidoglycan/LPS O-acetylase OafA/YrhL